MPASVIQDVGQPLELPDNATCGDVIRHDIESLELLGQCKAKLKTLRGLNGG